MNKLVENQEVNVVVFRITFFNSIKDYVELPIVLMKDMHPDMMRAALLLVFMALTNNQCKIDMVFMYKLYTKAC